MRMRTLILALGFAAVASTTATAANAATGTTGTSSSSAAGAPAATPSAGARTSVAEGARVTGNNVTNDANAGTSTTSSFAPGGPFSNDSGNSALGTSAGQSTSGTAAGNSSNGAGFDSTQLGTVAPGTVATVQQVPEGSVSVVGGGGGSGTRFVAPANAGQAPTVTLSNTPLYDQAAREGRAKEERRRARGEEPRVYGIAPNTDRDLTHQMPDDKVIRY